MGQKIAGAATVTKYTINKEDIIGMIKSGLPDEEVEATFMMHPTTKEMGWLISVMRKIYGEEHISHSWANLTLIQRGPEWVAEQHKIIDTCFENARVEHPKAQN